MHEGSRVGARSSRRRRVTREYRDAESICNKQRRFNRRRGRGGRASVRKGRPKGPGGVFGSSHAFYKSSDSRFKARTRTPFRPSSPRLRFAAREPLTPDAEFMHISTLPRKKLQFPRRPCVASVALATSLLRRSGTSARRFNIQTICNNSATRERIPTSLEFAPRGEARYTSRP